MELHSPAFEDFQTRPIQKTRHGSAKKHLAKQDVSNFIQSALGSDSLNSDPWTPSPREDVRAVRKRAAHSGGIISSKKKQKMGLHDWNQLMSKVKWPGLAEQEDPSDIDSYSEDDDCYVECESVAIVSDEEGNEEGGVGGDELATRYTSTPMQGNVLSVDYISDFDSDMTPSPPTRHLYTTPHNTHLSHLSPPQDNAVISSGPSSPELDHTHSRTKTSDWLRGVGSLEPDSSHLSESDQCTIVRTTLDSAKKTVARGARRRFVEGGLAQQLERVVQRETVDLSFWQHRLTTLQDSNIDLSSCLTVQVLSLVNCFSLCLATCHLTQGQTTPSETTPTEAVISSEIVVLFSSQWVKSLNLRAGSQVRIHPPWQCLSLPSLSLNVIIGTLFCQSLGHTPPQTTPTSPVHYKQGGMADYTIPIQPTLTNKTALTLSPEKSWVTSLYNRDSLSTGTPPSPVLKSPGPPNRPGLLLDAIEHAQCGVVGGVTGRVIRVYRRNQQQLVIKPSNQQLLMYKRLCDSTMEKQKAVWCFLVCDATGVCAEIQQPYPSNNEWSELIRTGSGKVVHFCNLKLIRRTNRSRNPELVSLISSLQLSPPLIPNADSQVTFSTCPPSFCYILQVNVTSPFFTVTGSLEQRLPTAKGTSETRVKLLARVLHYSGHENIKSEDTTIAQPSSSDRFLIILTPSHLTPVTVYLKPTFLTDGLQQSLSTPGTELLLKDVIQNPTRPEWCTLDACSMIIPLDPSYQPAVYPLVSCCEEELSHLHTLTPPTLPHLNADNAHPYTLVSLAGRVAAVDEDNAYSWPVCSRCGNGQLGEHANHLHCDTCGQHVITPDTHIHLVIFLKCKGIQNTQIHVSLLQTTVEKILPLSGANIDDGFDIHCVLGKLLHLPYCHVDKVVHNADGTVLLKISEIEVSF